MQLEERWRDRASRRAMYRRLILPTSFASQDVTSRLLGISSLTHEISHHQNGTNQDIV